MPFLFLNCQTALIISFFLLNPQLLFQRLAIFWKFIENNKWAIPISGLPIHSAYYAFFQLCTISCIKLIQLCTCRNMIIYLFLSKL